MRERCTIERSLTLAGLMVAVPAALQAQTVLPQGGSVVSGQARIAAPSTNALSITQNSSKAIVDWNSFSVGPSGSVSFVQPNASSAILNRVTGSTSSSIAGAITGNGQVFLVNPNGIAITPTGTVQVGGGFVASTLNIGNADFNSGNFNFTGKGASAGVSNAGTISSSPGGFVGLIGGTVSNSGTISVPLGKVGLGSGERATLDPTGDGFLQVAVPTGAVAADGRALVDVAGRIRAAGGSIAITAATAQQAVRNAVNVTGALSARSVSGRSGHIVLDGGAGGNVSLSGKLSATGGTKARGGSITVTGDTIALRGALVDVSGGSGGGTVLIGGGPQGSGPLPHAATTSVDSASLIKADATVNGNGGNVTVWSDQSTSFAGHISARGGAQGGNGGEVEVSGNAELDLSGDYSKTPLADLRALRGTSGTVLFDPGTVNIVDQTSLANHSALNGPDTFTAQFISGQLASANVTIDTNNATGANGNMGDINLLSNASIAWSSSNTLTLNAARNINFAAGASVTGTGASAGLVLRADSGGTGIGTLNFSGGTQVSLPSGSVDLYYNPASNRTVANGGSNNAAGSVNASSYTGATPAAETWSSFISAGTLTPWMLVNNAYDLQNINNNLTANYALGNNIDASATSGWNSNAGFVPLGTDGQNNVQNGGNGFAGSFDGGGHVIDQLGISRGSAGYIGLFGNISATSAITNVGMTNVAITGGGQFTGALVGFAMTGSSISKSYSTGAVMGTEWVGGLIGRSQGSITSSSSSATVSGATRVGGLIGQIDGSLSQSYATGAVTAAANGGFVGGLVGYSYGSVSQSYATGAVAAGNSAYSVGGLIGEQGATATTAESYATGSVASNGQGIGGLVGRNIAGGTIDQSYATGAVSGTSYVGGLVGWNDGSVTQSYAIGAVTAGGGSFDVGGLVGLNNGSVGTGWSSGAVSGAADVGGLVGLNNQTISASYYDQTTSAQANGVGGGSVTGVTGLTTAQAFTQGSYAGWDFTNIWWMDGSATRPFLRSEYSTTIVNAHQLQLVNLSNATLGASYDLAANIDATVTDGATFAAGMWTSSGFVPLGTDGAGNLQNGGNGFSGSLDGAGRTISGLTINRGSASDVGLFGYLGSSASISNVGLVNASVAGHDFVGGLVGENNGGAISISYAAGAVSGNNNVGGLVGQNDLNASIRNAYATATVTAAGAGAGGLIGNNNGNGSIVSSYATGATSGGVANQAGGLAGLNSGTATIVQSYFDQQTTGQSNGIGQNSNAAGGGVTGLTTATFQNGSLPAGLNLPTWTATSGAYPALYWQTGVASQPMTTTVVITATDVNSGTSTYGQAAPTFSYSVTDGNGNVLCTSNCAAYFSGTPLIDSTLSSATSVGAVPGYIAQGTLLAEVGYRFKFINDMIVVNPAPVSVTALGGASKYGSSPANPGLAATGLQNGQNVSALAGLRNSFGISNTSNAGSYTLDVAGTLTNSNYTIAGINTGSWTVNPASVTVTALGGSSAYGTSPSNPGLSATGLQNGQSVSVLTGLRNSFGISNTSSAGNYTLEVVGTLTNPNYTVVSASNGNWIVGAATVLRGSMPDRTSSSSHYIPGIVDKVPPSGTDAGALRGLDNLFAVSIGRASPGAVSAAAKPDAASADPRPPAANPDRPAAAAKTPAAAAAPPSASPIPPRLDTPRADASPAVAPISGPVAQAGCRGGIAGDRGCDAVVPNKPAGLIDAVLSKLNRNAFAAELDRRLAELRHSGSLTGAVLTTLAAGTTLTITVGVIGWLERGGALLGALLTALPVLRGFDPLVVFVRPRRGEEDGSAPSDLDLMFDDARSDRPVAKPADVIASAMF